MASLLRTCGSVAAVVLSSSESFALFSSRVCRDSCTFFIHAGQSASAGLVIAMASRVVGCADGLTIESPDPFELRQTIVKRQLLDLHLARSVADWVILGVLVLLHLCTVLRDPVFLKLLRSRASWNCCWWRPLFVGCQLWPQVFGPFWR